MLCCSEFYGCLLALGIDFFVGVPDSLLKHICAYITDHVDPSYHIICANEGNALALAAGSYFATEKIPLVYLQNSGIGNMINPLLSLNDPEVFGIPALILIGWRGEPGVKDEPQHLKQGKVTIPLLEAMGIKYNILPADIEGAKVVLSKAILHMKKYSCPYALVVKKGTFLAYQLTKKYANRSFMSREEAIQRMACKVDSAGGVIVTSTGHISRELCEYRYAKHTPCNDFYMVGSMGHVSQIALGIALRKPDKNIFCFDGDGSVLMHMGGLATIGARIVNNFKHIVFNNGVHESVGGQETVGDQVDFMQIASGCGYKNTFRVACVDELDAISDVFIGCEGPSLLEIVVSKGSRHNLSRPRHTPVENKIQFMEALCLCSVEGIGR
jgi:phosphonopyruvate decarboxylase